MSALTSFAYKRNRGSFPILIIILLTAFMHPTELPGQGRADTVSPQNHIDTLKTVIVNASKLIINRRIDKTVVKIEGNQIFDGNSLQEILEKLPGVVVTANNTLNVNGSNVVGFQINGKDLKLPGSAVPALLKSLQSAVISTIEIINPSAKMDAQHAQPLINIILTKQKLDGLAFSTTLQYSQGIYPKYGGSAFSRIKHKKISGQLLLFENDDNEYSDSHEKRLFNATGNSGEILFDKTERENNIKNSLFLKPDFDIEITKRTSVGVSGTGNLFSEKGSNRNQTSVFSDQIMDSILLNQYKEKNDEHFLQSNFIVRTILDTAESKIEGSVDFSKYTFRNPSSYINSSFTPGGAKNRDDEYFLTNKHSANQIWSGRIDYTKIISQSMEFDAGARYDAIDYRENYSSTNANLTFNSIYQYQEKTGGIYLSSAYNGDRFSALLGLRYELSNTDGFIATAHNWAKRYSNLFPSISVGNKFGKNKDFEVIVGFNRRIQRPPFLSLSPYEYYTSPFVKTRGDINLAPTIISEGKITVSYKFLYLNANVYSVQNGIELVPLQIDSINTVLYQYTNVKSKNAFSVNASAPFNISGKIRVVPNLLVELSNYSTNIQDKSIKKNGSFINMSVTTSIKISKRSRVDINSFYSPRYESLYTKLKSKGSLSIRYFQSVMKNKFSIKLSAEDIFNTNRENGNYILLNQNASFKNFYDYRRIAISFTYNFNKGRSINLINRKQNAEMQERISH